MQKKGRAGTSRAGKIALYGMMTALAFLLSYVETLIPINLGVPGVKLGLANLASIVSLYLLGGGKCESVLLSSGASGSRNGSGGADWASRRNPGKPLKMSGFDKIYVNGSHKSTGCTVTVHMQAFLEPKMP